MSADTQQATRRKISLAIDTTMMDGRYGKGTATVVRENLIRLEKYKSIFDITLVHKFAQPNDPLYENFNEIIIPRLWNGPMGGTINEFLFFINTWLQIFLGKRKRFDIYFVCYSRLLPFFMLAPAKKFVFYPMDGGPKTANYKIEKVKTPFPWYVRIFKNYIDFCFAISDFGKRGIIEEVNISEQKVGMVYCDSSTSFNSDINSQSNLDKNFSHKIASEKYNLPDRFLLSVSRWDPHKNTLGLVQAYATYRNHSPNPKPLVFVGGKHMPDYSERVDKKIKELNLVGHVIMSKYIEENDLKYIYNAAEFNIFPSFYEGFGIPVVEAQRSLCPLLISYDQALMEVAGLGALVCNPYDTNDIANKMLELDQNDQLKKYLVEKGSINQLRFSWDQSTEKLVNYLKSLVRVY